MKIFRNLHMIIGSLLLVGCLYVYVESMMKDSVLIESFEGKIGPDTLDFGSSVNSSLSVKASRKISRCGRQAVEVKFNLKPYGYAYLASGYGLYNRADSNTWMGGRPGWIVHPDKISWADYGGFSILLKGKDVGKVAIDLRDSGGELWRTTVHLDSGEWKKFTVAFDDFSAREDWQPPSAVVNKYIDYPFTSFQIEPKKLGKGTLYADCAKFVEL